MSLIRPGVTCFFGQTYTGKTTLMRRQLEREAARALVFDPSASRSLDSLPSIHSTAGFRQFMALHSVGRWIRTIRTAELPIYAAIARSVKHWRGVVWVLDDANALLEDPTLLESAKAVATAGRHMGQRVGVELWIVAQRPMFVHHDPEPGATDFQFRPGGAGGSQILAGAGRGTIRHDGPAADRTRVHRMAGGGRRDALDNDHRGDP
jgi:hypothetical protein